MKFGKVFTQLCRWDASDWFWQIWLKGIQFFMRNSMRFAPVTWCRICQSLTLGMEWIGLGQSNFKRLWIRHEICWYLCLFFCAWDKSAVNECAECGTHAYCGRGQADLGRRLRSQLFVFGLSFGLGAESLHGHFLSFCLWISIAPCFPHIHLSSMSLGHIRSDWLDAWVQNIRGWRAIQSSGSCKAHRYDRPRHVCNIAFFLRSSYQTAKTPKWFEISLWTQPWAWVSHNFQNIACESSARRKWADSDLLWECCSSSD